MQSSFVFAEAVLGEATLSFLGAGAPPSIPSWGGMLNDSKALLQQAPWTMLFPGRPMRVRNGIGDARSTPARRRSRAPTRRSVGPVSGFSRPSTTSVAGPCGFRRSRSERRGETSECR